MSYIAFTVLQQNEKIFIKQAGSNVVTVGESRLAPKASNSDVEIMGEFWAVPIKDNGIFRGYNYKPVALSATAPTFDSFKVTRVKDKVSGDNYVLMVTLANYLIDTTTATTAPVVVIEHTVCANASNQYVFDYALPYAATPTYSAYVSIDGVLQDAPVAQASLAALVTWLNTNIPEAGTWSANAGLLHLVNTDGKKIGVTIIGA